MMTTTPSPEIKLEIKRLIMTTLSIQGIDPDEIDDDEPLFGGNNALTLDSVDALEIIMAIQRTYQVRIGDQNLARSIIRSINSIAEFISSEQEKSKS